MVARGRDWLAPASASVILAEAGLSAGRRRSFREVGGGPAGGRRSTRAAPGEQAAGVTAVAAAVPAGTIEDD